MSKFHSIRFGFFAAVLPLSLALAGTVAGCKSKQPTAEIDFSRPDYTRKLRPGESALRLITDPSRMPDIGEAYRNRNVWLLEALDRSEGWFRKPSSKQYFPIEKITHDQAQASVTAFSQLLQSSSDEMSFVTEVMRMFDVYESVGYNGEGIVLFTGYYAPDFQASRTQSAEFSHPLYKRPADLMTDAKDGRPLGRKLPDGRIVPCPTRRDIEQSNMYAGNELVWVRNALDAYIIHVNGSAKLRMDDGSIMYIGYAGKTDRPYYGLGQAMMDEKLIPPDKIGLPAIRKYYQSHPEKVEELIDRNECYVFFTMYEEGRWPSGSLGVKVSPETTLATDKSIYPRGGVLLVDTKSVTFSQGQQRFLRFMLDQDTGGAIQAPGRADIYMGEGSSAEILAGGQYAEGRLYYFFLKPEYMNQFGPMTAAAK